MTGRRPAFPEVARAIPTGRRSLSLCMRLGVAALACVAAGIAVPAMGQTISQPVVQALPSRDSLQLSAALSRLGRNPRDIDALIDAGNAAIAMGDIEAAVGFFKRATQVNDDDPRAKIGLAGAMARNGNPIEAIALFDEAERAGGSAAAMAADRGLAYDLVGDNAAAQKLYRLALAGGADDEVRRRLALSFAISGDKRGVEETLLPLLREQDKAAWRARAFSLAIMGRTEDAVRISNTVLPAQLAGQIAPYLRYMPQLTPAQQAAAVNLGVFPRASEIGRDDPRIAQFSAGYANRRQVVSADAALVPAGAPLGAGSQKSERESKREADRRRKREAQRKKDEQRKARAAASKAASQVARVAPPDPRPARQAPGETEPDVASADAPVSAPKAEPASSAVQSSAALAAATPSRPAPSQPVAIVPKSEARPGFDLARLPQMLDSAPAGAKVEAETPLAGVEQQPAVAPRPSLAAAFSDLGKPVAKVQPAPGAVDITAITPAKPKPAAKPEPESKPAKPSPPSHPSRIWVQLGIGRDTKALAFDWKRLSRKAPDVFKGQKGWVSEMGQTNRMLTGPFESARAANAFVADLRKAEIDGPYVWTSPAGQVVDALP